MTIVECILAVLDGQDQGLSTKEIYDRIIEKNLYSFRAENPVAVVNSAIRRQCYGINFATAYPEKKFVVVGGTGRKLKYAILNKQNQMKAEVSNKKIENADLLPEEEIEAAVNTHIAALKKEIAERVLNNSPAFFERLVVDLLLKMGYGYDENSGFVTGQSHDEGIDGIIFEDKLGLDRIYIQAKRYAPGNRVGRGTLQAFVGAMEDVHKGVFITTSQFTNEAKAYADKQQQKNIKLIDGSLLSELLVKYEVGLDVAQELKIYKIDVDYYGE